MFMSQLVRSIHVTGTNGKGSVCAFLSAILRHAGFKVGRFTSPHLIDWRECITVDEHMIDTIVFDTLLHQIDTQMKRTRIPLTQVRPVSMFYRLMLPPDLQLGSSRL